MRTWIWVLAAAWLSGQAGAEVIGVEVEERSAVLGGKKFGAVGAYERIVGTVRFAVDPQDAANARITDLKLAPQDADGRVLFSADFYVLTPKEPEKGSGTVLFEVSNRGGKGLLGLNRASGSRDPQTQEEFGDGLLMELVAKDRPGPR